MVSPPGVFMSSTTTAVNASTMSNAACYLDPTTTIEVLCRHFFRDKYVLCHIGLIRLFLFLLTRGFAVCHLCHQLSRICAFLSQWVSAVTVIHLFFLLCSHAHVAAGAWICWAVFHSYFFFVCPASPLKEHRGLWSCVRSHLSLSWFSFPNLPNFLRSYAARRVLPVSSAGVCLRLHWPQFVWP